MTELKRLLMERDDLSSDEADEVIAELTEAVKAAIERGDDAEEVLLDEVGLEGDYLDDLEVW